MEYTFTAELFQTEIEAAWVFLLVPPAAADEISEAVPRQPGFGSVRVEARIGSSVWQTSIFPSKEFDSYLLPVKRAVRDCEQVDLGDSVQVTIRIRLE